MIENIVFFACEICNSMCTCMDCGFASFLLNRGSEKPFEVIMYEKKISGADFTKGLKPRFTLKFKTLVLNFVNRMSSLWSLT